MPDFEGDTVHALLDLWVVGQGWGRQGPCWLAAPISAATTGKVLSFQMGENQQQELAKPSETKILFLCKCPLEIKLRGERAKGRR